MSNTNTTTPTHSADPKSPDYEVPDPKAAWEAFDQLVGKVLNVPQKKGQSEAQTAPASSVKVEKVKHGG